MKEPGPPSIDGLDFVRLIGKGGMATVWEARQRDTGSHVAVKILDDGFASNQKDVEAFCEEARTAALLDHPNIVTVFQFGCQGGRYYYVMELAAGYDTGKWLERKGRLEETDVLTVAESVGVALEFASRELGLIHCDIKPGNIMVDGDGTVKLTDMGIARVQRGSTQNDYITGTPQYMSPEQTLGDASLDARTDIYSLGATMYHLLAGRPLFSGSDYEEIMEWQRSATAEDVRLFNKGVSAPCATMLSRFLAKDRNDRPADWNEAVSLIRETLGLDAAASAGHPKEPTHALLSFDRPSTMPIAAVGASETKHRRRFILVKRSASASGARSDMASARRTPATGPLHAAEQVRKAGDSTMFWFWTACAAAAAFAVAFAVARMAS